MVLCTRSVLKRQWPGLERWLSYCCCRYLSSIPSTPIGQLITTVSLAPGDTRPLTHRDSQRDTVRQTQIDRQSPPPHTQIKQPFKKDSGHSWENLVPRLAAASLSQCLLGSLLITRMTNLTLRCRDWPSPQHHHLTAQGPPRKDQTCTLVCRP